MDNEIQVNLSLNSDEPASASSKKDQILERLNKRNKERQNYLDVKIEQRHKDNLQLEGADYFSQSFAEKVRDIETRIQNVIEASSKKSGGPEGPGCIDLTRHFADITVEIQELERYLTTSTMFLTEFKVKSCQNIMNELKSSCEDTRLRLIPKKKFGFSGRKVAPKATLNPKLSTTIVDKIDGTEKESINLKATSNNVINWTLSNLTKQYLCLKGSDVNGKDITISNLDKCFVELQGHAGSVQISNCTDCTFLCGPISRSLFAEYCNNCTLAIACQQLRFHSSAQCRIYLHVTCRAIIEDCKQIEVDRYNYDYLNIAEDFQQAGLNRDQNNYADVADFNWLSPDVPSPNWHLIEAPINWQNKREQFQLRNSDNASL